MRFSLSQKLKVETESGTYLGRVADIIFEGDAHSVGQYVVKQFGWFGRVYLISPVQVVKFTKEKMIVEDSVKKTFIKKILSQENISNPEPVAMREKI